MRYIDTDGQQRIGFDFYCDVAQNIVRARKDKGWTAEQLAKEAGIKLSLMKQIEGVKIRIELEMLEKLAKALNVSIDWLIDAEILYGGQDCLFLCWSEAFEPMRLYQRGPSVRMAYLLFLDRLKKGHITPFMNARDRIIVKLVGVPVSDAELRRTYKNRTEEPEPLDSGDDEGRPPCPE